MGLRPSNPAAPTLLRPGNGHEMGIRDMEESIELHASTAAHGAGDGLLLAIVARQPVFDSSLAVAAYELLYRTPGLDYANVRDPALATAQVVVGATLDIGFRHLVGEHPAYINFPAELLASGFQPPAPPQRVVIELLEGAAPAPELLVQLGRLRGHGYRVALDDFDIRRDSLRLVEHADIVKVDVREHSPAELAASVQVLRRHPVRLVAEKIETREELAECRKLGFDLFQGYFLHRPQVVQAQRAPSGRLAVLQLVLRLAESGLSLDQIEAAVRSDLGMSYRILRCINSSYYGRQQEVSSIREAVVLLGMEELHRLCWLMLLAGLDDRPSYACVQSLQRARMCELLCEAAGLPGAAGYFVVGMLSMLDVLLGQSMQDILRQLPIGPAMSNALLFRRGDMGEVLRCVERYERGDWRQLQFHDLGAQHIVQAYLRAAEWADSTWQRSNA